MTLLYTLFAKFVPIISIWEMKVGEHPLAESRATSCAEHALGEAHAMSAVYALYSDGDAAQRAVNGLRAAGVADDDDHGHLRRAVRGASSSATSRQRDLAVVHRRAPAALVGLRSRPWLTRMTELAWPLQTGNMPIVAWWPNLIVIFEMTMLGAILATVVTLFVTAKLPRRRPALYDPEVTDGKILVGVENPPAANLPALERALAGRRRRRTQKELIMRRSPASRSSSPSAR